MAEKKEKKTKKNNDVSKLNLSDARVELQKLFLAVKSGEETNTSKIKTLKKHIARLLTEENNK